MIEICGFTLTGPIWLIGWGVLAFISLILIGITKSDDFDEETFGMSFGAAILSAFWPLILICAVLYGVFAIPVYIGKYIGKGMNVIDRKKKKKLENMETLDKILKNKEVE